MTVDEVLGNEYSRKGLVKATEAGYLYDYIAQWYYQMSTYDLKEVLLAVLGVGLDQCGVGANRDVEEAAYNELLLERLADREFGED